MKVLLVSLLFVAGAFAGVSRSILEEGPRCPIEDPLERPEGPVNITLHPIIEIPVHVDHKHGDLVALGLSSLWYNYSINIIALTATFHFRVPTVSLDTTYMVNGYLDARPFSQVCLPSGNFSGSDRVVASAENAELKGAATLFINLISNKLSVRILTVETLTFSAVSVDLGQGYQIAGAPVDWAAWTANFKTCFDNEFPANKAEIVEKVRIAANEVIGQYTLEEFLDLIGGGGDEEPCE